MESYRLPQGPAKERKRAAESGNSRKPVSGVSPVSERPLGNGRIGATATPMWRKPSVRANNAGQRLRRNGGGDEHLPREDNTGHRGSSESELALGTAVDLANSTGSELHVVHVVSPYHPDLLTLSDPALFEEGLRGLDQETEELLDGQVRKIEEAGGSVQETHLRRGREDQQIVDLGEEIGAGLIVMGSSGRGGIRRVLMGSVSDSVVRHAHCPVLVVRKEEHQAPR